MCTIIRRWESQRIKIGQTVSMWVTINGGVPQGTKPRPLLFVVPINDFDPSTKVLSVTIQQFMTDSNAMKNASHWSKPDAMGSTEIYKWLVKTMTWMEITFSVSSQAHLLILEGEIIEKVNTVKLLGIYIQDDLKHPYEINCHHGKPNSVIKGLCFKN